MPNLLDITRPETSNKPEWVNLDMVFHIAMVDEPGDDSDSPAQRVALFSHPGGNGLLVPDHISIEEVTNQMRRSGCSFSRAPLPPPPPSN